MTRVPNYRWQFAYECDLCPECGSIDIHHSHLKVAEGYPLDEVCCWCYDCQEAYFESDYWVFEVAPAVPCNDIGVG